MIERMRANKERTRQQREMEKASVELKNAAAKGRWEDVKKIVTFYGASDIAINTPRFTPDGQPAETALTLAVQGGFTETVKELLQAPCIAVNTNDYADQMNTPLLSAVMHGYTEIAIALASKPNTNVNMVGGMCIPPLIYAVYHCQGAIPALLAAKTMSINCCDSDRRTALMHAILNPAESRNSVPKTVTLLMNARDIDLNAVDNKGWTALMFAAQRGNAEIMQALLEAGANPAIKNHLSQTAEDILLQFKHSNLTAILRQHEADKLKRETTVNVQPGNQQEVIAPAAQPAVDNGAVDTSVKSTLANSRIMRFFTRAKFAVKSDPVPERVVTLPPG